MLKQCYQKYRTLLLYGVFGVLTTIINFGCYKVFYDIWHWPNVRSNIIAWVAAVLFAFVTNKLWVFDSKTLALKTVLTELWRFISCRLATGVMDLLIMYVGVDLLHGPSMKLKIGSNVLVILLNYTLSKLIIFNSRKEKKRDT